MDLITQLKKILPLENVLSSDELQEKYHHIWHMDQPLNAKAYIYVNSTNELSEVMKLCDSLSQPVIIFGGLTNLVGATETTGDELIISMQKLNSIHEVDVKSRTITVDAGVILENIQNAASEKGLLFPLNFGAKGTAQIGGIISTNAGGLRVFRFGMTRNLILGLEIVLADGTIISSLKKIIKDNSAYDLKQLFIGSEGTLGIVTKAVLKLVEAPKSRNSAFVAFNDFEKVIQFLKISDQSLAGTLSGFELIWNNYYTKATTPPSLVKAPIESKYKYYVLIESLGSNQELDYNKMETLLEQVMVNEVILDGAIASNDFDLTWFWTIREDVRTVTSQLNNEQHFDISLPIPKIGIVIDDIVNSLYQIDGVEDVVCFGHVADGNIHIVVGKANTDIALTNAVNDIVYGPLKALGGSISAEHGIGLHKKKYLHLCRSNEEIALMKQLKKSLDPRGILNPGKVLDIGL